MGGSARWDFRRKSLTDFALRYVDGSREVEAANAEAASVFIHSLGDAEFLDSDPGGKPLVTP